VTVPPTTRERGHATRQRLLTAAEQLIAEVGWGSVTTRKIAERAGVPFGVVHYHFSSVTDLLIAASLQFSRAAIGHALDLLMSAPDVSTGIARMLAALDSIEADDSSTLLSAEAFLAATREERLREQLTVLLDEFRRATSGWLREHGSRDPEPTAAVLAAVLDGLVLHRALDPSLRATALIGPLGRLALGKD
jgi:TetR/AcrR family transcriptional regulator, regulator of biofilm formation and stress response